ncbi:MAG: hypothetical protein KZQ99_10355 [Candidatus Thiodiazotropha sp. (ex Dulcina madagascariensis)]|nr:hypothetical protein [Candidatus Thiodiazotropha sp. (ex Dulcina madagascariensis)]
MEYFNHLLKTLPIWPFIVLSALFTGLIVLHVNKKNAFRKYATEFRNAFNQELTILESKKTEDINVRELLLGAFDKHSEAVTEFREHVSILKKRGFNKAWVNVHVPISNLRIFAVIGVHSRLIHSLSVTHMIGERTAWTATQRTSILSQAR